MRVMIIRKADAATERGEMPSEQLLQAMADYNQALLDAGVWHSGDGLRPSADAVRIQFRDGEPTVTDGPFTETTELLAGYTVLNVDSMAEAVAWARKWPELDSDGNVALELRPYFEMEDFAPGDAIEQHNAFAERTEPS